LAQSEALGLLRVPVAGILAWIVPGLGHIFLGHRGRGLVFLVTITATFWTGVAIGGVRGTVNPQERSLWFVAQLCTGINTAAAYGLNVALTPVNTFQDKAAAPKYVPPYWMSSEVGVHYTGVAGLLNLLVILDALARAEGSVGSGARRKVELQGVT
jgi:hypothetical protein